MRSIFWQIYKQPLRTIWLTMLFLLILWTVVGRKTKRRIIWKRFNGVVFLGIMAAILYVTLFDRGERPQEPVWIPFYSFVEAKIQPELYRSMLMNIFLFLPFGLSLPNILPKKAHPVAATIAFAMLLSMGIEAAQLVYGLGRCEVDDVIMNTLGAAMGTAAYCKQCRGVENEKNGV